MIGSSEHAIACSAVRTQVGFARLLKGSAVRDCLPYQDGFLGFASEVRRFSGAAVRQLPAGIYSTKVTEFEVKGNFEKTRISQRKELKRAFPKLETRAL